MMRTATGAAIGTSTSGCSSDGWRYSEKGGNAPLFVWPPPRCRHARDKEECCLVQEIRDNQALLAGVLEADVQIDPFMQVLRKLPVVPTCEERRAEKETATPRC